MKPARILVAEDDRNIRDGLVDALQSERYEVTAVADGVNALRSFKSGRFDLILLDLMMPGMSGYDVCREVRKEDSGVPVIMLTAKSEEVDKVVGLELGADDYITKPFGVRELLARVSAALRRSRVTSQEADSKSEVPAVFQIGGGRVDCRRHSVFLEKRELALTARELALLKVFYQYPNEVLTRDFLLNQVWGVKYFGTTRTLDQHIAQLRKKIEPAKSPTVIRTVHGVGYRYDHYG